jgi:hypothetical protein
MLDSMIALQIGACLFMTGVIAVVQVLHYPGFSFVDARDYPSFQTFHMRRITWIVGPAMLAEAATAAALVWSPFERVGALANLGGVLAIWISTALWSVPLHDRLQSGKDLASIRRLTATNWPRTTLWALRSACWLLWLRHHVTPP